MKLKIFTHQKLCNASLAVLRSSAGIKPAAAPETIITAADITYITTANILRNILHFKKPKILLINSKLSNDSRSRNYTTEKFRDNVILLKGHVKCVRRYVSRITPGKIAAADKTGSAATAQARICDVLAGLTAGLMAQAGKLFNTLNSTSLGLVEFAESKARSKASRLSKRSERACRPSLMSGVGELLTSECHAACPSSTGGCLSCFPRQIERTFIASFIASYRMIEQGCLNNE